MGVAGGAKVSAENGGYPLHGEFARLSRIGELNAAPVFRDCSVQVLMEKVSRHFGPLDGATLARGPARTKMADQPFVPGFTRNCYFYSIRLQFASAHRESCVQAYSRAAGKDYVVPHKRAKRTRSETHSHNCGRLCERRRTASLKTSGTAYGVPAFAGTTIIRQENATCTVPNPANCISTRSPAFSHTVFTRLPVSTICPARRALPSSAR
jgi:hypothetical protein